MTSRVLSRPGASITGPAGTGRAGPRRTIPQAALGALGLLGLLVVGELIPRTGLVSRRFFPTSSDIASALWAEVGRSDFWGALRDTVQGWALGLAIAVAAAIIIGVAIGSSRRVTELTASTIEFLRPIPSVALIPLAVLLFGTQIQSKLLLVVYAAFWQMLIQVLYGVQDVDPVAADTARSYRLGAWARIRHVTWPTALPYVMTGFRLAAAVALILAVTAELVIGNPGIGQRLAVAQSSGAVPTAYALVVVTGLLGIVVNVGFRAMERRLLAWHPSQRGEVPM